MQILKSAMQIAIGIIALAALPQWVSAGDEHISQYRVDCRYYSDSLKFCYASAIYTISHDGIKNIKYGVGCNYETIYNDHGMSTPQSTTSDSIRPQTSALPNIEIMPQDSLKHPGTYTSKLEVSDGKLADGVCYVNETKDSPYGLNLLLAPGF